MKDPIRIRAQDSEAEARKRHADIEQVLDYHGAEQVRSMVGHGFPTNWNPIITAWLNGDRLDPSSEDGSPPAPGATAQA